MVHIKFQDLLYDSQEMGSDFSKIKDGLTRNRMNQSDLARSIGVERATVSAWIRGTRTPSLGHLMKVAKVLNMSLSEILGEEVLIAETQPERKILQLVRKLSPDDLAHLERLAEALAKTPDE
jgi:transcriptional regulator with XRE-family HTH domain